MVVFFFLCKQHTQHTQAAVSLPGFNSLLSWIRLIDNPCSQRSAEPGQINRYLVNKCHWASWCKVEDNPTPFRVMYTCSLSLPFFFVALDWHHQGFPNSPYVKKTPAWLFQHTSSHIFWCGCLHCSYCKHAFIIDYMTPLKRQGLSIHAQFEKIYSFCVFFFSKSSNSLIAKACLLWAACGLLLSHLLIKLWTFKLPDLHSPIFYLVHLVSLFHGSSSQQTM